MKNKILFQCPECNHKEIKKISLIERLLSIPKVLFITFIIFSSFAGTLATHNFIQGAYFENEDRIFSLGGAVVSIGNVLINFQSKGDKEKLRDIALNLTKGCEDDYCKIKLIYLELWDFPYNEQNDGDSYNPLSIWESGKCDCDECSYLLMYLLKTLDIKSTVQASYDHAWNLVYLDDKVIWIDLTSGRWEEVER